MVAKNAHSLKSHHEKKFKSCKIKFARSKSFISAQLYYLVFCWDEWKKLHIVINIFKKTQKNVAACVYQMQLVMILENISAIHSLISIVCFFMKRSPIVSLHAQL